MLSSKRYTLLLICSIYMQTVFAQKNILLNDLSLFKGIFENAHAGLYKYHSRQQIDSIFNYYASQINEETTTLAYYKYLSAVLSYVGSLHDDIYLPSDVKEKLEAERTFFPYPVKMIDGRLLVNTTAAAIPLGAEIVSINGRSIEQILPDLYKYYTTDGVNTTGKQMGINARFGWFYRLEYGAVKIFDIAYRINEQASVQTIRLSPVTWADVMLLYKSRHSLAFDTTNTKTYSFNIIDGLNTGVLTIPSFSLGNEHSAKHKAYKRFLKRTFTILREKHVSNLIVDIRHNGGGSDPNDLLTFSYLATKPFRENSEAFTIFQKIPYRQYCTDPRADKLDIQRNFRKEHNVFNNGRYFQHPKYNPVWQVNPLAFSGKIYLLVSPAVASAASLFAAMIKSEGAATVIGEETMGGYYGHTGHNKVNYRLPGTGIAFRISVVDIEQFVTPKENIPFGVGVLPDITVRQTLSGFMNNHDTVLDTTLRLIKKK